MHIESVSLTNFRCFGPESTVITLCPDVTALVGANGAGKSAFIEALRRVFGPTRDERTLTRADVPLNLPAGWDFKKVFGPQPKTQLQKASATKAIAISNQPSLKETQQLRALPQGSTPADLLLIFGLLVSLIGLTAMIAAHRRFA